MKKGFVITGWIAASVAALVLELALYSLSPWSRQKAPEVAGTSISAGSVADASFSEGEPIPILPPLEGSFVARDARPKILASFLAKYSCPLTPYHHFADKYVEEADKNGLDFRLVPAISMQESNCCKKIPGGSNNCWGYGIYGDQVVLFPSFEKGIETVSRGLAKNYTSKGLMEPEEIMKKYTPQSKGSWAAGVLHFMNEMK